MHTFSFDVAQARYLRLVARNNWGNPSNIQLTALQVWTRDRQGGIVSLREGLPPAVVAVSSQAINNNPAGMLDTFLGNDRITADDQIQNQWAKVRLGGGRLYTISRVRLQSSLKTQSGPKEFEIRVSTTTADDAAFTTVFSGAAANSTTLQEFQFAPVAAR